MVLYLFMSNNNDNRQPPPSTVDTLKQINNRSNKDSKTAEATVGFAITVTGCGAESLIDAAAVLKHSIHLASVHGNLGGRYDYTMYAIYHPDGEKCALPLQDLGYVLVRRETPVKVEDIEGEFLRTRIRSNGCCGEKELVKLEAYTFVQHPIVVHLDLDVLVLKPLDPLFDWMIQNPNDGKTDHDVSDLHAMWPEKDLPPRVNAFFTRDCKSKKSDPCGIGAMVIVSDDLLNVFSLSILLTDNMIDDVTRKYKPVQGGFLVLRPDVNVYNEFVSIIKKGDFQEDTGWGGILGMFYGCMTFQGVIPYYYDILHPGQAVEVNRCVFNQMADNPKDKRTVNDIPQGRCRTGEDECEDCRNRPISEIVTAHFTLCQKPWLCLAMEENIIQSRLCRKLHHEWHRIRSDMEQSWGRPELGPGQYQKEHFYGHCGKNGYLPIERPYGPSN